jgi:hypothetical protein
LQIPLLPQGKILREWGKKQAISVQKSFFETLPELPQVAQDQAEIAWNLYDFDHRDDHFRLVLRDSVYTEYWAALNQISTPEAGKLEDFIEVLQQKLDNKLDNPPDTQTINDIHLQQR